MTREETAITIEAFIDGTGSPWDWDDFLHTTTKDNLITDIQRQCVSLPDTYPPDKANDYCNDKGIEALRGFIRELRNEHVKGH
jgi:hypothetical protein